MIAAAAGFFAAISPDGLENVAHTLGFEVKAGSSPAVFVDYQLPAIPYPALSMIVSGIIGIFIIIFIFRSISNTRHIGDFLKKLLKL